MSQYIARWWDGFQVTWRDLTWAEYQRFRKQYDESPFEEPMEVALDIYKATYLKGPDPLYVPAGIPGFLCKQQMVGNPFSGLYEDIAPAIDMARKLVTNDYLLSAKGLISSTLNYRPEEIDNWDPTTFFIRLAQTEIANGRTFDPVDPNIIKDSKGRPVPTAIKRNLSPAQQKAISRTKDDRGRG